MSPLSVQILHKIVRRSVYVRQYDLLECLEKADQQFVYFPLRLHLTAIIASSRLILSFKVTELSRTILSQVTYFQVCFVLYVGLNNVLKQNS